MHFSNTLLVAGLIAFASASPAPAPEPTTPTASQSQALVDDLQSYILELATNPIVSSLATDTAALSSLQSLQASLQSDIMNGETPNTSVLTVLPSPIASFIGSIYTAELSILSKDGFGDLIASTAASEAASASTTGASQTASGTQKTSTTGTATATAGSASGTQKTSTAGTAGTASASSTAPVASETGAAGALGVDMLKICGGLAVGLVGAVVAL